MSIEIIAASKNAIKEIAAFISKENHLTDVDYLHYWFFDKPVSSCAISICKKDDQIEGLATTNNFNILQEGKVYQAAMPQKVLTSAALRGQGYFGKMYNHTEKTNLERNKVDYFLTITNEASTDIFIKKFNYERGMSPDVHLLFAHPCQLISKKKYKEVNEMPQFDSVNELNNGFVKDNAYFQWRYNSYEKSNYRFLSFDKNNAIVLKSVKKGGLPFYMIMEVITDGNVSIKQLIKGAKQYAIRTGNVGVMAMDNDLVGPYVRKRLLRYTSKQHFNFLVKGKSIEQTNNLAKTKFNFFFGDLDFV